jgi:hypothetical protein
VKRALLVLWCTAWPLFGEITFLRMTEVEASLTDAEQKHFEETYGISNNNCSRHFYLPSRRCNGVFMVHGELSNNPTTYSCDSERCSFECGK